MIKMNQEENSMKATTTTEHDELLGALDLHRQFLKTTALGLDDAQARETPTVSELSVGGIIKHVAATEAEWVTFILDGAPGYESTAEHGLDSFTLGGTETLESAITAYDQVAVRTENVVNSIPDLSSSQLLPEAPWFPPGATWSVRRVVLHLIAETAQHAGHADIIRETIDGAKTMG